MGKFTFMQIINSLNITGISLNFIGSIILAISLSCYLTAIHGAVAIHDMQIKSHTNHDSKILNADVANLLKVGVTDNRLKTIIGLIFTITGFGIQLIALLIN